MKVLLVLLAFLLVVFGYQRGREIVLQNGVIDTTIEPHFLKDERHKRHISLFSDDTEHQYMVHVAFPLKENQKREIEEHLGAKLGVYLPHNTYLLVGNKELAERATNAPGVHWVGALLPEYKYPAALRTVLSSRSKSFDTTSLLVHLIPELPENTKRTEQEAQKIAELWKVSLNGNSFVRSIEAVSKDKILITLSSDANSFEMAQWVSERPESHWVEPGFEMKSHNSYVGPVIQSNDHGLPYFLNGVDGTGEIVGLADSGIATGSCYFPGTVVPGTLNPDAKIIKYVVSAGGDTVDADGHGTHVAGTIAGNTTNNVGSAYNGVAPGAKIHFTDISSAANTLTPPSDLKGMFQTAYTDGARLFVASFGASNVTWYTSQARDLDSFSSDNKEFLIIVSAGNEGTGSSLSSLAVSKNALVVGASQSTYAAVGNSAPPVVTGTSTLASFTSRGPTPDGRIKPDIVAPAQSIVSASNTPAGAQCAQSAPKQGTSYAAGVVGGAAALVRHWFTSQLYPFGRYNPGAPYSTPSQLTGDIVKAVIINSGQPLEFFNSGRGNYINLKQFPSSDQGFGRVQLNTVLPLENQTALIGEFNVLRQSLGTGESTRYCFKVEPGASYVKATLVWHDPAGSLTSGIPLVNNLDLAIVDQQGVTFKTDTADGGFDALNNVEQVTIKSPQAGVFAVHVYGFNIAQGGSQAFALVVSGAQTSAFCDVEFDSPATPICPSGCSGSGTCRVGGFCNCTNPAVRGLDCTADPCVGGCNNNGICDYTTGTCVCKNGYAPPNCASLLPPTSPPQPPPAEIVTIAGSNSGINTGLFIGVVIAAFIVGCLCALIIGGFGAVKFLEYKRDQAHKEAEHAQDQDL